MTTILIKKKDTAGAPAPGDLTNAAGGTEIAVNTATKRIYTKDAGGNVVELGTNASSSTIADLTVTTSTTLSYGTANQVQYLNASKLLVGSGNMTFDGTTLTANALTVTNATTLSAGTANGVAYLNGSKVLTTGSALTFDGVNLQVGGGASGAIVTINGNANGGSLRGQRSGTNHWFIGDTASALGSGTGLINYVYGNDPFIWYNSGVVAELMRLTSTGLGIGTSATQGARLAVVGGALPSSAAGLTFSSGLSAGRLATGDTNNQTSVINQFLDSSTTEISCGTTGGFVSGLVMAGSAAAVNPNTIRFFTAGTEQMRLTSTGLGIGTSSPNYRLDVAGTANAVALGTTLAYGTAGEVYSAFRFNNSSFAGGNSEIRNIVNGAASTGSALAFFTTQTGSGPLTERLRLDNVGNLTLGTTAADLYLIGGSNRFLTVSSSNYSLLTLAGGSTGGGEVDFGNQTIRHAAIASLSGSVLAFYTNSTNSGQSVTERARITSGGTLVIGGTSDGALAGVVLGDNRTYNFLGTGNAQINNFRASNIEIVSRTAGYGIDFYAGAGSFAGRFTGGGDFVVGGTVSGGGPIAGNITTGSLFVNTTSMISGNASVVNLEHAGGSYFGIMLKNASTNNSNALTFINSSNVGVGSISVTTTSTSYNTFSDYRLKEDIQPMTGALEKVAALKPVTYKWKANGSDGEGFIAHELAEVCPQAVSGEKDGLDSEGNPRYQGIDTSFLVATLAAAIQELKAEFDAYKATHP